MSSYYHNLANFYTNYLNNSASNMSSSSSSSSSRSSGSSFGSSRNSRSYSLERSYSLDSINSRINNRSSSVGPSTSYYGYMPFCRQLESIESRIKTRGSSIAPVSTYRNAYSGMDRKAMDYALRLDSEESTRDYINNTRYGTESFRGGSPVRTYTRNYDPSTSPSVTTYYRQSSSDYCHDPRLSTFKHFRKSNATLENRNSRALSPVQGRELDRYFKTVSRSDYLGDVSSGGVRDFRYYNYRTVPYYGGSDYYAKTLSQNKPNLAA